jgi:broad specificity phosphatase PhoE
MEFLLGFVNATVYIGSMIHLFLIRHGETDWNRLGRFQGARDIPLNEAGRRQAEALARNWDQEFDVLFTSPLSRARETAGILAESRGLAVETPDPRLAERAYGEGEGLTLAERKERFGDHVPGMEEPESVRARGVEFSNRSNIATAVLRRSRTAGSSTRCCGRSAAARSAPAAVF